MSTHAVVDALRGHAGLVRVLANSAGVALVLGSTWFNVAAGPAPREPSGSAAVARHTDETGQPVWRSEYSKDYPGCVALALWPGAEQPVALLTRTPDGSTARVALAEEGYTPTSGETPIGACR